MKKVLSMLVVLALMLVSLSVCAVAEGPTYKIGVLAPPVTHGWVAAVTYNAEARCQELQAELGEDVLQYNVVTAENAEQMVTGLSDLMTWGANAVVCFPQWEGMEDPIAEAVEKGVVVVNFDIDIAVDGIYKVTGDNYSMGTAGADYIVDKIGTEGVVVALSVPTSGSVSELRMGGFMDRIAEIAPDMDVQVFETKFTREDGLKDMADILTTVDHIDAVYSLDDETSIGALQAITEAGRDDIKVITGGGGCQEYFKMMPEYENIYVQSALYSPSMVREAVDMAIRVLDGEDVETPLVIPSAVVDKTNYTEYLNEDSPY